MSELEKSVTVRCDVEHAFDVFTDRVDLWWPAGHRRFERSELVLEARVGGRFVERSMTGEEALLGEVTRCERPHLLIYTWYPGADRTPTEVTIRFSSEGAQTRVDVTHAEGMSGLGDKWPERRSLFERAWSTVLPAFTRAVDADPSSISS